ncbi:hypothetical protein WJX73_009460 [Symbiochloris irregularis]|uniref:Timeless N-terminal domain-containing protein n=1 Tax=Symbiochloris irregularis TaxID=706552 RepID=A0AAW1P811_9CHLO
MDNFDQELLISVTGGLGSWQQDESDLPFYAKDADCLDCLKDLQRFLRQDDPEHRPAFTALCKFNIARSDLVPLIISYADDMDLVYNALKVVTFLTMPIEPDSSNKPFQLAAMQTTKEAFLAQDALAVVTALVAEPLARHPRMTQQDALLVQLVITFLRNLLTIPDQDTSAGSRGDHRTRLRQDLLRQLFEDHVMELLMTMAQHADQAPLKKEAPLLLEIFHCIFGLADVKQLMAAGAAQTGNDASRQHNQGSMGGQQQAQQRRPLHQQQQAATGPSHKRMPAPPLMRNMSTFVRRSAQNPHDSKVLMGKGNAPALPPIQQSVKAHIRPVREQAPVLMTADLQAKLREFMQGFLVQGSYSRLMGCVRKDLEPGMGISRLPRDSFVQFLQLARTCTCFVRLQQEEVVRAKRAASRDRAEGASRGGLTPDQASPFVAISATMGWETFHLVQVLWLGIIDLPLNSPEKDWELQHAALALMKELLFVLDLAQQVGNSADRTAADRLQRRLLQDDQRESGLLPVLARLIKGFSHRHQPRSHAGDLVECVHVVLRLLDRLCNQEAGGFVVKRRVRPSNRRPKAAADDAAAPGDKDPAASNDDGSPSGRERTAAPDADAAGSQAGSDRNEGGPAAPQHFRERDLDPFEEMEDEEEREAARRRTRDVEYDMKQRLRQELAVPPIVHFYTWLLRTYSSNSDFLNHCLVSFLKRLSSASGLNLEPMLYQLSVLRLWQQVLSDKALRKRPAAAELLQLATRVTRSFFARLVPPEAAQQPETAPDEGRPAPAAEEGEEGDTASARPVGQTEEQKQVEAVAKQGAASMLFLEILFWKPAALAAEIRDEYNWRRMYEPLTMRRPRKGDASGGGPPRTGNGGFDDDDDASDGDLEALRRDVAAGIERPQRKRKSKFTQQQQARLVELFEQFGHLSKGYLEGIVEGLGGDAGFSEGQVRRELRALGLRRGQPTERQVNQLRELMEQYGSQRSYLAVMAAKLGPNWKKATVGSYLKKAGIAKPKARSSAHRRDDRLASSSDSEGGDADRDAGQGGNGQAVSLDQGPSSSPGSAGPSHEPDADPVNLPAASDADSPLQDARPKKKLSAKSSKESASGSKRRRLVKQASNGEASGLSKARAKALEALAAKRAAAQMADAEQDDEELEVVNTGS